MLNCFQNIEWQTSGIKADANTSLKAVANKSLAQTTMINQHLKTIHQEIKNGNEALLKAVADGFGTLASAFAAAEISSMEPLQGLHRRLQHTQGLHLLRFSCKVTQKEHKNQIRLLEYRGEFSLYWNYWTILFLGV